MWLSPWPSSYLLSCWVACTPLPIPALHTQQNNSAILATPPPCSMYILCVFKRGTSSVLRNSSKSPHNSHTLTDIHELSMLCTEKFNFPHTTHKKPQTSKNTQELCRNLELPQNTEPMPPLKNAEDTPHTREMLPKPQNNSVTPRKLRWTKKRKRPCCLQTTSIMLLDPLWNLSPHPCSITCALRRDGSNPPISLSSKRVSRRASYETIQCC